ncbi:hypothetical protein EVA_21106 [gut metagenome]|uniref:Uncharacterized protein n=1 Tax=gut metagenome TaxID=749906 RepID=J9BTA3_9ZZZZ
MESPPRVKPPESCPLPVSPVPRWEPIPPCHATEPPTYFPSL